MRFDAMREPISVRIGVSSRSVTSALRTVRQARSAPATLRSAFIDSVAPTVDSFRYSRTSSNSLMGLPPVYAITDEASSVCACSRRTSSKSPLGRSASARSLPIADTASPARRFRIFGYSSTRWYRSFI